VVAGGGVVDETTFSTATLSSALALALSTAKTAPGMKVAEVGKTVPSEWESVGTIAEPGAGIAVAWSPPAVWPVARAGPETMAGLPGRADIGPVTSSDARADGRVMLQLS